MKQRNGLFLLCLFLGYFGCRKDAVLNSSDIVGGEIYLARTPAGTADTMIAIPMGEFWMGSNRGFPPERPARKVFLDAYYIDKYEVTNARYLAFVAHTGRRMPAEISNPFLSGANQPVVGVYWADARAYCQWRGGDLPTEAQWEKAARGMDGRSYPWGEAPPSGDRAVMDLGGPCGRSYWYAPSGNPVEGEFCHSLPVGSKPLGASAFGLMDMAGNVWEWCRDWYDETYYATGPRENPRGPETGDFRVVRGSSWHHLPHYLQAFARFRYIPDESYPYAGFRCVQEIAR